MTLSPKPTQKQLTNLRIAHRPSLSQRYAETILWGCTSKGCNTYVETLVSVLYSMALETQS
jgi:hypothetical protein